MIVKKVCIAVVAVVSLLSCKQKTEVKNEPATKQHAQQPQPSTEQIATVQPTKNAFLWRIGKAPKESYLYGTIHIPDDRILALPKVVQEAIDACDSLYVEVPMDMSTKFSMVAKMMLADGKLLSDILPKPLFQRLDKLMKAHEMPEIAYSRMKVWVVATQVLLVDHLQELASKKVLDMMIYEKAQKAGKKVGGIETVDEQLAVFDDLGQEEQISMLTKTLDLYDKLKKEKEDPLQRLVETYLAGDEKKMFAVMNDQYDENDDLDTKVMKRLISDRNVRMTERIQKKLSENPDHRFFFAVGVGHMVGADGVTALLQKKGLTVERVAN